MKSYAFGMQVVVMPLQVTGNLVTPDTSVSMTPRTELYQRLAQHYARVLDSCAVEPGFEKWMALQCFHDLEHGFRVTHTSLPHVVSLVSS